MFMVCVCRPEDNLRCLLVPSTLFDTGILIVTWGSGSQQALVSASQHWDYKHAPF